MNEETRKYDEIKEKYEKIKINDFISHRPLINALFGGTVCVLSCPACGASHIHSNIR